MNLSQHEAPVITIDGAAGTGKGTISKLLAQRLGWHYLDSGVLYRVLAYSALIHEVDLADEDRLAELALAMPLELLLDDRHNLKITLLNQDITEAIRDPAIGQAASKVSALAKIRSALLQRQRDFCQLPGLVTDGRDMGTVVFPQATVKLFFTADLTERAQRRVNQLKLQGINATLNDILQSLNERDKRDSARNISPLKPAEDAVIIETSGKGIDEVYSEVITVVMSALGGRAQH